MDWFHQIHRALLIAETALIDVILQRMRGRTLNVVGVLAVEGQTSFVQPKRVK